MHSTITDTELRTLWTPLAERSVWTIAQRETLLHRLGWTMAVLVLPLSVAAATNAHLVPDGTENPWIKPIKFSISLATLLWTLPFLMHGLRLAPRTRRLVRNAAALGAACEVAFVTLQAGRTVHRVGPATAYDHLLVQGASASILLVCAACTGLAVLYLDDRRVRTTEPAMLMAVRRGLVVFLVGSAVGGFILARGSHLVTGPHGSGDLRISHFIALHAIQLLPMVAWVAPRIPVVRMASALVAAAVATTFALALLGR